MTRGSMFIGCPQVQLDSNCSIVLGVARNCHRRKWTGGSMSSKQLASTPTATLFPSNIVQGLGGALSSLPLPHTIKALLKVVTSYSSICQMSRTMTDRSYRASADELVSG